MKKDKEGMQTNDQGKYKNTYEEGNTSRGGKRGLPRNKRAEKTSIKAFKEKEGKHWEHDERISTRNHYWEQRAPKKRRERKNREGGHPKRCGYQSTNEKIYRPERKISEEGGSQIEGGGTLRPSKGQTPMVRARRKDVVTEVRGAP